MEAALAVFRNALSLLLARLLDVGGSSYVYTFTKGVMVIGPQGVITQYNHYTTNGHVENLLTSGKRLMRWISSLKDMT